MNERKIFRLDEIVKMKIPKVTKEFSIKEFFEDNHRLFTVLGIFGGLSYYLTNLASIANECDICSLISKISNTTPSVTTTNTPPNSIIGLDPNVLLQFGILLSYLVFVGVLGILIIETLKHNKNFQRSLFIYGLCFLCIVVIIYSIAILQSIIPYFVFITVIYFCGLTFAYIHDWVMKRISNDVMSIWFPLSPIGIIGISIAVSLFLNSYLVSIMPKNSWVIQQNSLMMNTYFLMLFGLLIGIFFVGTSITMIRFINDLLTYNSSLKGICIISFSLIIIGVTLAYFNLANLRLLGFALIFIGFVALFSPIIDRIKEKYSLIF